MRLYEIFPKFRGDDSVPMTVITDDSHQDLIVVEYRDEDDVNVADRITDEEREDVREQLAESFMDDNYGIYRTFLGYVSTFDDACRKVNGI